MMKGEGLYGNGKFLTVEGMKAIIEANLNEASELLAEFIAQSENILTIERAAAILKDAVSGGHKIISCGNGGSGDPYHYPEYHGDNKGTIPL